MSWLIAVKVWPALQAGTPPDYRDEFIQAEQQAPPPVAWDLYWNDEPIGMTVSQASLDQGVPSEVRSLVELQHLEVQEVMREFLGGMSFLTSSLFGDDRPRVDLTIATKLRLDWEGELQGFETSLKTADADLVFLRGNRTEEDRLRLTVLTAGDEANAIPLPQEFNLPTKSRYSDAFSPRTRMQGLSIGQKWTTPVVSPLGSSDSIRLVESLVEKRETIVWQGDPVEVFVVVYRYDAGSGSASRKPVGMIWVRTDGLVVRQELPIGNARVRFERTSDSRARDLAVVLEEPGFDRYLHSKAPASTAIP